MADEKNDWKREVSYMFVNALISAGVSIGTFYLYNRRKEVAEKLEKITNLLKEYKIPTDLEGLTNYTHDEQSWNELRTRLQSLSSRK